MVHFSYEESTRNPVKKCNIQNEINQIFGFICVKYDMM